MSLVEAACLVLVLFVYVALFVLISVFCCVGFVHCVLLCRLDVTALQVSLRSDQLHHLGPTVSALRSDL